MEGHPTLLSTNATNALAGTHGENGSGHSDGGGSSSNDWVLSSAGGASSSSSSNK